MKKIWFSLYILLVVSLASVVRLVQLDRLPAGLNRDEAALGYNAYLLFDTGRDEWGQSWPLSLQSFGDYKLVGYVAAIGPFLAWLGQTTWAIRLPAALAGIFTVMIGWGLARRSGLSLAGQAVFVATLALGPVFIFYGRMGWEATLGLMWWLLAGWLLQRSGGPRRWLTDCLAGLFVGLAIMTYNTPWLLTPLLVAGVILARGWRSPKTWWWPVSLILVIWVGLGWGQQAGTAQKSWVTIFADPTTVAAYPAYRASWPGLTQKLFGNQYVYWLSLAGQRWVQGVSPGFLVWNGGAHPWHQVPGTGHVWLSSYVLAVVGWLGWWWRLVRRTASQRATWWQRPEHRWQVWWAIVTPLALGPASITVDAPHATRSLFFIVGLVWWGSWAFDQVVAQIGRSGQSKRWYQVLVGGLAGLMLFEAAFYPGQYFTRYPAESHLILRSGLDRVLAQVESDYPQVPVAIVDEDGYLYTMVAWYLKLPEAVFRNTVQHLPASPIGLKYGSQVGRYRFVTRAEDRHETEPILVQWEGQDWKVYDFRRNRNPQ